MIEEKLLKVLMKCLGLYARDATCFTAQDRSSQPSTSSSIPSKYQTFFKSATENKGFHRQAPRFEDYLYTVSRLCTSTEFIISIIL